MRHIHALAVEKVPRDDEYKFRERAKVLVDKWRNILNASKTNGDETVPAANGKAHSEEAGGKGANGTASPSQEPAPAEKTEKKDANAMEVNSTEEEEEKEEEAAVEIAAEVDAPAESEDAPADAAVEGRLRT